QGQASVGIFQLSAGYLTFTNGQGVIAGNQFFLGNVVGTADAILRVDNGATADINAQAALLSDAEVDVQAGSELTFGRQTTFYGGGNIHGEGLLRLDGSQNTFSGDTTINMPNGRVDLDGNSSLILSGQTLNVNAIVEINAQHINDSTNTYGAKRALASDTININNFGRLGINLTDPNDHWTMAGHLQINAITGQLISNNLSGSDMLLTGTADVYGNSNWNARTDIKGTVNIHTNDYLRLAGGDLANPSRLEGGSILGDGTLGLLSDDAVMGYGTIGADISFMTNSELRADDGTLVLTPDSNISVVGIIGTQDNDGILEVQHAWNTNVANTALELRGGQVQGGAITNGGTTRGFGRIASSEFENRGLLKPIGGELTIGTTNAADLDGVPILGVGTVDVTAGDLRVEQALHDTFNSTLTVGAGHYAMFEQGWTLSQGDILSGYGKLNLNGSLAKEAWISGGTQKLAGVVNVDKHAAFNARTEFLSTTQVNLVGGNDQLRLLAPTVIESGATFSGAGRLINEVANDLLLASGATVGVHLQNDGTLQIDSPMTDATVLSVEMSPLSVLQFDLRSNADDGIDQLNVVHHANLDGQIALRRNEGGGTYSDPSTRGDFEIITLLDANSHSGSFDSLTVDGNAAELASTALFQQRFHENNGLFHIVDYHGSNVRLINYLAIVGDANGDGSFNSTDLVTAFTAGEYEDGIAHNSTWLEGDWDGDQDFTSTDFVMAFQTGLYEGSSVLPAVAASASAVAAVPEPTSLGSLAALAMLLIGGSRRRTMGE
ncbi:MAG: hypothetical protein KDB23_17870, partial [Planctomycetales bacterium]|nr:hypothetical protein [Planctomycetales bacterium]